MTETRVSVYQLLAKTKTKKAAMRNNRGPMCISWVSSRIVNIENRKTICNIIDNRSSLFGRWLGVCTRLSHCQWLLCECDLWLGKLANIFPNIVKTYIVSFSWALLSKIKSRLRKSWYVKEIPHTHTKKTNYTNFPVKIALINATDVEKQYRKNKKI